MTAVVVDLDAVVGDTRPLWEAWLADVSRRARVTLELPADRGAAPGALDRELGNWRALLERFAEDHAAVHLRPEPGVNAALRALRAGGARVGAFTDAPEPLARVAAAQLGVARCLDELSSGARALERLLERLGPDAVVIRSRDELLRRAS